MKRIIVLFRNNLRIRDNSPLYNAAQDGEVLCVYCDENLNDQRTPLGFPREGIFRRSFRQATLRDLSLSLGERGCSLLLFKGHAHDVLPTLCSQNAIEAVYTAQPNGTEERAMNDTLKAILSKANIELRCFDEGALFESQELPSPISEIPRVFTKFRRQIEAGRTPAPELPEPPSIRAIKIGYSEAGDYCLDADLGISRVSETAFPFSGGEKTALQRVHQYFWETHAVAHYKETRNGLVGRDYSSKLSPWLSLGAISPRTVYHLLKRYEREHGVNDSTYWLYFELLWREFFRHTLTKDGNRFFGRYPTITETQRNVLANWIGGRSGDDFVDAQMIEIAQTGWMSNRGRQVAASYLIYGLNVDWWFGAEYFESQLIDYDVASNYGNWRYIAGQGNDPRGGRVFNSEKQARAYDPTGEHRALWLKRRIPRI
jgi:deoxyribodipyrimidine photo-lyase